LAKEQLTTVDVEPRRVSVNTPAKFVVGIRQDFDTCASSRFPNSPPSGRLGGIIGKHIPSPEVANRMSKRVADGMSNKEERGKHQICGNKKNDSETTETSETNHV
jgi:hypothetical protein